MPFGLLTGLGAALSWGTMDIASALASRRVGSLLVTAGVVVVSAVLLRAPDARHRNRASDRRPGPGDRRAARV